MTFMRKIMDALNMDNWEKDTPDDEPEVISVPDDSFTSVKNTSDNFTIINLDKVSEPEPIISFDNNETDIISEAESSSNIDLEFEPSDIEIEEIDQSYHTSRVIIPGLHLYFIDVAREIISANEILQIPLMREYNINSSTLTEIINDMQTAGIINNDFEILMSLDEFEHFIDIYNPNIFDCPNSVFDKDIFMCIGEIMYEQGVPAVYNCLSPDETLDYLNIFERMSIVKYDSEDNLYTILISKDDFDTLCNHIPNSFSSHPYEKDWNEPFIDSNFDSMDGLDFEKFCANLLSENSFFEIKITPASGDHGIDILAEKDGITYAIQCKCYSSNIGNDSIQQAHTGKSLYHKDIAVVMTNRYFTPQAVEEANTLGVKLWDRDKLNSFIKNSK